jgi:hypothetical protein
MLEYVKEQDKIEFIAYDNLWEKVINFANFLSQQPNIGMFVKEDLQQYQTSLDNVIFEGFEVCEDVIEFPNSIEELFYFTENKWWLNEKFKTLEDLTKYNLTITPKFAKELGLI